LIFAVLAFALLPSKIYTSKENDEKAKDAETKMKTSEAIKVCLKLPGVWLVSLFLFSCFSVINTAFNYMGTYTTQIIGIPETISSFFSIIRVSIIPLEQV